jgi:membrane AbrB-like protein
MLLIAGTLNLALTIAIALASGLLLRYLGAPAPYLLGSLFGVWLLGGLIAPLRSRLGVPRWLHVSVTLGMGVMVGAMFDPGVLDKLGRWSISVAAMMGATVVATLAGFTYLSRYRKYPASLSWLCCLPGGQAEILAMSRGLVEKDYVVALCHLVRVATVFCITPLLLTLVQGQAAVDASNRMLSDFPGIASLPPRTLLVFFVIAGVGYLLGRMVKLPMPHFLGPLVLSAVLHVSGILAIPRIQEFVLLAQVVIGGAVGARLAQVRVGELLVYLLDALINSLLVIGIYAATAFALSAILGMSALNVLLAFIPGGFYEVTLLALLFGFDVAMVTFHHTIRVLIIFFSLPFIVTLTGREMETSRKASAAIPDRHL